MNIIQKTSGIYLYKANIQCKTGHSFHSFIIIKGKQEISSKNVPQLGNDFLQYRCVQIMQRAVRQNCMTQILKYRCKKFRPDLHGNFRQYFVQIRTNTYDQKK